MAIYDRFSATYYDDLYPSYDYRGECDYLEDVFDRFLPSPPKRILDVGCGTGSHALILGRRGFEVTGVDTSLNQIERAKKKAKDNNLTEKLRFIQADMRDFVLDERFDVAISLFGSFGYLINDDDVRKALQNIRVHLADAGLLIFEFWNIGGVKPEASSGGYRSWDKSNTEKRTIIRLAETRFIAEKCSLRIDFDFVVLENNTQTTFKETHFIRVYSPAEIRTWLEQTGFDVVGLFDTSTFDLPKSNSFRIKAIAKRHD